MQGYINMKRRDVVHVIVIEASMPEVIGSFIHFPHLSVDTVAADAEALFRKTAEHTGNYTEDEIECGLEDGLLNNGDWGVFIHWSNIDILG